MGSDVIVAKLVQVFSGFNSRSRMGSDLVAVLPLRSLGSFNSRSRMGSDGVLRPVTCPVSSFNSRSRMGSDPRAITTANAPVVFQFALPHGERRLSARPLPHLRVSIRAPAWGATHHRTRAPRPPECFNSRSRMGSDYAAGMMFIGAYCFNSRSRMGSDQTRAPLPPPSCRFNSRSRMGSDQSWFRWRIRRGRFNSRSRMGSDGAYTDALGRGRVSIRAPAWGATRHRQHTDRRTVRFNSRSRMGSDAPAAHRPAFAAGFNSRSRMGSDSCISAIRYSQ